MHAIQYVTHMYVVSRGVLQGLLEGIRRRDPDQPEFLQAVDEVLHTVAPVLERNPQHYATMQRLAEPERMILFRVPWCGVSSRCLACALRFACLVL